MNKVIVGIIIIQHAKKSVVAVGCIVLFDYELLIAPLNSVITV